MPLPKLFFLLVLASAWTVICVPTTPLHADLVLYLNMDGNVDDHSGSDNHGELFDGEYSDDVPPAIGSGQSISFDSDEQHIFCRCG